MSEGLMTYSDLELGIWNEIMNIIKVSPLVSLGVGMLQSD